MATKNDLKAEAEEKMNAAQAALSAYVESNSHDLALLAFLIRNVDQAIAYYQKILDQQQEPRGVVRLLTRVTKSWRPN